MNFPIDVILFDARSVYDIIILVRTMNLVAICHEQKE